MRLTLILVFVFCFGILTLLAEKITHYEQRKGLRSKDDSSVTYRGASRKRGVSRSTSGLCSCSVYYKLYISLTAKSIIRTWSELQNLLAVTTYFFVCRETVSTVLLLKLFGYNPKQASFEKLSKREFRPIAQNQSTRLSVHNFRKLILKTLTVKIPNTYFVNSAIKRQVQKFKKKSENFTVAKKNLTIGRLCSGRNAYLKKYLFSLLRPYCLCITTPRTTS